MEKKLLKLHKHNTVIAGRITLPASKSLSNRALLINALSYSPLAIDNLSASEDTILLQKALCSNDNRFKTGDGGTTIRFLTAFLSKIIGEWIIDCSQSMKQRPIGILVDALNSLGANISYLEKTGFPPLKILGSHLQKSQISIPGNISSQYISALLLIAPTLENGLKITLTSDIVSLPYIKMTLKIMQDFGIKSKWEANTIHIIPQEYKVRRFSVESDWSSASYWYSLLALSNNPHSTIILHGLYDKSYQGDRMQVEIWQKYFGISTTFTNEGILIRKDGNKSPQLFSYNFKEMPDLAQTFAVSCCILGIPFIFNGLETLEIKETNRIIALKTELAKLGFIITSTEKGTLQWQGEKMTMKENITIQTYNDHRMAMAFAPIVMQETISIATPSVVRKSYPNFWKDLASLGITTSS